MYVPLLLLGLGLGLLLHQGRQLMCHPISSTSRLLPLGCGQRPRFGRLSPRRCKGRWQAWSSLLQACGRCTDLGGRLTLGWSASACTCRVRLQVSSQSGALMLRRTACT